LAYVRHKIIKGHKYFYLVEGYREGAKVRQRVLLYLGASEPSERVKQQLKKQYSKPKKTGLGDDTAKVDAADTRMKEGVYAAYEYFGLKVRHNLTSGGTNGAVLMRNNKPYAVSLIKSPNTSTMVHELGHVIDFILRDRAKVARTADARFAHVYSDDTKSLILQEESAALARQKYTTSYSRLLEISEKKSQDGYLAQREEVTLSQYKKFFTNYAETQVEGFANAFALYLADPDLAEEIAPRYCEVIFTLIGDEPDMQEVVDSLLHSPAF
jgi:hypothetical protein